MKGSPPAGKVLIFRVTAKDCRLDTFRAGGKGGQHQNKTDSGVRWTHEPSGAVGESREHRSQLDNKRTAWGRMGRHPKMTFWLLQRMAGEPAPTSSESVDIPASELRIETRVLGRWMETDL